MKHGLLREKCRLRVFKNRTVRLIFGRKNDENGEWRRQLHEGLHSLCLPPNIVRMIKSRRLGWEGYLVRMEEGRRAFKILTAKPTIKRVLGWPKC